MATSAAGPVLIVGSGLIGRSWAMLFASGGFRVKLYDIEQQQITDAVEIISTVINLKISNQKTDCDFGKKGNDGVDTDSGQHTHFNVTPFPGTWPQSGVSTPSTV
ncbi:lambda-crystallin homolog [Molossus nigricans]